MYIGCTIGQNCQCFDMEMENNKFRLLRENDYSEEERGMIR